MPIWITHSKQAVAAMTLLACCVVAGCQQGPETAFVSGVVTFDGEPLDDAEVQFYSADGKVPVSLDIVGGAFEGNIVVGEKTLRFFALRPNPQKPRPGSTDAINPYVNVLPDHVGYGSKIKLTFGDGNDTENLKYDLTSK